MHSLYLSKRKDKIILASKPFAAGGEGQLFKIRTPKNYQDRVAKIYHPHKLTEEKIAKIRLLLKDPLAHYRPEEQPSFVWPEDIIENERGEAIGFIMRMVSGKKLELFCLPTLPKKMREEWGRFALSAKMGREFRLRIAFNLANALYRLQQSEKYVLVDFKPENVLLQTDGQISIVDVDSLQILENGKLRFKAAVTTPEYAAAEYYRRPRSNYFSPSWDNFALAVIIYKLLLGIHPFAASAKGKWENLASLHQKIEAGLFVHHPKADQLFSSVPPPHQNYHSFSAEFRNLFQLAFVEGHKSPELRPNAEKWCWMILQEMQDGKLRTAFEKKMSAQTFAAYRLPALESILPNLNQYASGELSLSPTLRMAIDWKTPIHFKQFLEADPAKKYSAVSEVWLLNILIGLFITFSLRMLLIFVSSSFASWLEEMGQNRLAFLIFLFFVAWSIISLFIGLLFGGAYPRQKLQNSIHDLIQSLEHREKQMLREQEVLQENIKKSMQKHRLSWQKKFGVALLDWEAKEEALAATYQELLTAEKEFETAAKKEVVHLIQAVHPALQNVRTLWRAEEILDKIEQQAVLAQKNNPEEKGRIKKQFAAYRAALKKVNLKLQEKMKAYKLSQEERYQEFRDRMQLEYEKEEQKMKALYRETYANIWKEEERFHRKSLALWSPAALEEIDSDIVKAKKLKDKLTRW
ncbi:protein kinase domain-containing protein [Saprospira grandis]|uniref:non-specific serine/threonine protein kinase n=1 Tax=Saprospira grandis (strain Lewin) TaxID=984262 RepID=H6L7K7_SAPGL|nr:serine/threonine protein kinase [Saprospira grandis]AFC23039.1 serine/threonine protein kinase [Saprospira grandis str. Lewin]